LERRRDRGQALVEFAVVFPVFALLLFGLVDIGRLVYVNNAIAEGAREAARWGAVQSRSNTTTGRASIGDHAEASMAAVPAATITVTCSDRVGATRTTCVTNNFLTVQVTTTVELFTPVIAQIVGSQTVTSTAKVVVNQ
jgi:Flp pilus assembly protein TadG